jgi:hypothetical protein
MRITSGGNVLIGTTTDKGAKLQVNGGNVTITNSGNVFSTIKTTENTGVAAYIATNDINTVTEIGTWGSTRSPFGAIASGNGYIYCGADLAIGSGTDIKFGTGGSNIERMRITSGGNVLIGTAGVIGAAGGAFFQVAQSNNNWVHYVTNTQASGAIYGSYVHFFNQSPNNSTSAFFLGGDNSAERIRIYSNGGIANFQANNVNLSDERTKKEIFLLESYWDKFKAIEIVKFKYKDQTHDDFNIGVIAQQVESVAPEFVDVDGWVDKTIDKNSEPLKTIYTADLYHATIKVLQEAMTKIEELRTELDELKGNN